MKVFLGADHGGFELKQRLIEYLKQNQYQVIDCGAHHLDEADDYPDYAFVVGNSVAKDPDGSVSGILCCRSGAGVAIAANKVTGIRAAAPVNLVETKHAREHNDANVLCLGADFVDVEVAIEMVDVFLTTPFSHESRHIRRLAKISAFETRT